MSDTALFGKAAACLSGIPQGCQVLILSEDFTAYSRALQVCRRIMDQMGQQTDFDFRCWNFSELNDPECAHTATKYAAAADIIMLSTHVATLPVALNDWLETLHLARFRPVGVLALVLNKPARQPEIDKLTLRLENVALHLAMDFLPLLPATEQTAWQPQSPEHWETLLGRPDTEVRRDVDHWGLNE
jgi:hypothetical protein